MLYSLVSLLGFKDNSYLIWFLQMVYPMVRDIPNLTILHYNFLCRAPFSMAMFNKITHKSQVVLPIFAVGLKPPLQFAEKVKGYLSGNATDFCLYGRGIS